MSSPLQGPFTAAQVIEEWLPPPDFPDPTGAVLSYDKNGDGRVCVLPLPAGSINIIDNGQGITQVGFAKPVRIDALKWKDVLPWAHMGG